MQIAVICSLLLERLCRAFRALNKLQEPKGRQKKKKKETLSKAPRLQTSPKIALWPRHLPRQRGQPEAGGAMPPAPPAHGGAGQARHRARTAACHPVSPELRAVPGIRAPRTSPLTASDCCLAAWPYTNAMQTDSPPQLHHCLLLIQEIDSHMKSTPRSTFGAGWHILTDSQPHSGENQTTQLLLSLFFFFPPA